MWVNTKPWALALEMLFPSDDQTVRIAQRLTEEVETQAKAAG